MLVERLKDIKVDLKLRYAATPASKEWVETVRNNSEDFDPLVHAIDAIAFGDTADTAAILLTDEAKETLDASFRDELFKTAQQLESNPINLQQYLEDTTPLIEGEAVDIHTRPVHVAADF